MSLNLIFRYPDLYKLAMPSSFVSHQRFYHPGYQERFMGLIDENMEGYENGSPITWAHRLEGNLLIIHGSGDSNVHYQSFESLVNELVAHKKQFSMMVYPNRNHGIERRSKYAGSPVQPANRLLTQVHASRAEGENELTC